MARIARWALGIVVALLLLAGLAWAAVPPLLKWQLQKQGTEFLGREVRVGEVRFAPFTLTLAIEQLSIGPAPGAEPADPLLQVGRIVVDADARSLLRLAPVVEALEIDTPRLRLARTAAGRYDVDDLIARVSALAAQPSTGEPARFALFNLRLHGGEVTFDDRPVQQVHRVRDLRIDVPFLSNLPDDVQIVVEPRLAFELDGSVFDSSGRTTPFAEGRRSSLQLKFDRLELRPAWAYLPDALPVRPDGGLLSAGLTLDFEQHQDTGPVVALKGEVDVADLTIAEPGGPQLAGWQRLHLKIADVRPLQRRLAFEALQVEGARLKVERDAGGRLNVQRLAEAFAAGAGDAGAASASPPAAAQDWQLRLDRLDVDGAEVAFTDSTTAPAAEMRLAPATLKLTDLRWPVEGGAGVQLDATIVAAGHSAGTLHAEGQASDREAKIAWRVQGVDVAAARPYLAALLRPRVDGRIDAEGEVDWAAGDSPRLQVALARAAVADLRLTDAARRGAAAPVDVPRIEVGGVTADLLGRRAVVESVAVQRPAVELERDAAGVLSAERWAVAAPKAEPSTDPGWSAELRRFRLDGGRVRLRDAALGAPVELRAIRAQAEGLSWPVAPKSAPSATQFGALLATAGRPTPARIEWAGRVGLEPLAARGRLRVERLPAHAFEPWFGAGLPVTLRRLEAGFAGEVDLRRQGDQWLGGLRGDALLADLSVVSKLAGAAPDDELVSWNTVSATGLAVELAADRKPLVAIDALRIVDYHSRLEITEEGHFNLQQVAAAPAGGATPPTPGVAVSAGATADARRPAAVNAPAEADAGARSPAAASAAPGAVPEIAAPSAMLSRLPVDLVVGSTEFVNARVDFEDRFIRPNYRADLSELNGRVGRIDSRSRELATLQAKGRVEGTGRLEIDGALNPTVTPPQLDLKAKATDIELPGLTPYAAKYAGYPIRRGKLSVDVAYKIDADGKLEASNRIVVNQLTFGPKSDSPDATKLPVLLAVALLQDRNGVIDIDLPVSGSLNDPQFSLGGLIWKVIVNLLTKALTAPFSLLAGGSGGPDMSTVEFVPGTAQVTEGGKKVLDQVAKALADRPALKLTITGQADAEKEKDAIQRAAVQARIEAEARRERGRASLGSGAAAADAPTGPMSAAERDRLLERVYDDTKLPNKPRNLIGMAKSLPPAEMEALLVAAVPVDAATGRTLAVQRGRAVRDALIERGLPGERLFLAEPGAGPEADAGTQTAVSSAPLARLVLAVD